SGCWRALSSRPALPNSTSMRSVPEEMSERVVRICIVPEPPCGAGTSASMVPPVFKFWRICFMVAGMVLHVIECAQGGIGQGTLISVVPGQRLEACHYHAAETASRY